MYYVGLGTAFDQISFTCMGGDNVADFCRYVTTLGQ
jgi:hypothetical protein